MDIRPKRKYHEMQWQSEQKIDTDKLEADQKRASAATENFIPQDSFLLADQNNQSVLELQNSFEMLKIKEKIEQKIAQKKKVIQVAIKRKTELMN